ncbi:MAG: hypothetical protein OEO23_02960 [Gemmatimonadota bacterium]|nr:hypothetical protein [Gemmatimonadota bacterium]
MGGIRGTVLRSASQCAAWGGVLGSLVFAPGLSAQDLERLAADCAGAEALLTAWCQELTVTAAAVEAHQGLASGMGSVLPGSPSTVGLRLGSAPRVTVSVAPLLVRMAFPDVDGADGSTAVPGSKGSLLGVRTSAAVGVVDGWQLAPTVGGVFSMDALADWTWARYPGDLGFDGGGSGFGLGVRLGVFRESFTLPGVAVSVMQRWPASVALGSAEGGAGRLEVDQRVTSVRATVGKNLFAVGLLAGFGWDRYDGDVDLLAAVSDGGTGVVTGAASGALRQERRIYFVSGWFNLLISQLSVEAGLADGFRSPFGGGTGGFQPEDRTLFLSAAFRITV